MNDSRSAEMYLEAIYVLQNAHGHAHVAETAKYLDVTKPSVTKAINRLKEEGMLEQEAYGYITLTEKGKTAAAAVYYKHCILTRFLEKSLGLSPDEASKNACRMEHVITEAMLLAIENYLGDNSPSANQ